MVNELVKDGLNPLGDHGVVAGGRQEVGHASDDADGRLLSNLAKGVLQERQLLAEQELRASHLRTSSGVRLRDVAANVGIAND